MSPPCRLRFLHGLTTWRTAEMRLWVPSSWPPLSGSNSRTTGKKLEGNDLVRGSGCWILIRGLFKVEGWKEPGLVWKHSTHPSLGAHFSPFHGVRDFFLIFRPTPPLTREMRCPFPLPFHHCGLRWWFLHGVPSTRDLRADAGAGPWDPAPA